MMRRKGNAAVNKEYNPRNVKPPVPIDADEADSAMERFIRQKYEYRVLEDGKPKPPSRDDSGYHTQQSLDDSPPPPLPPKNRRFPFSLRSSSSSSHLSRSSQNHSSTPASTSSGSRDKASRMLGSSVEDVNSFDAKLDALRDMGFTNESRNARILKKMGGNLERTIEVLTRLGDESSADDRSRTPTSSKPPTRDTASTQQTSPATPSASAFVNSSSVTQGPASAPIKSYNPFDVPTSSQSSQTTGLEASFQNLQVSQPLFPHTTGGYPAQTQQMYSGPAFAPGTQGQFVNSPQPLNGNYNPFFQSAAASAPTGGNPYFGHPQSAVSTPTLSSNPFFGRLSPQSTGLSQRSAPAYGASTPDLTAVPTMAPAQPPVQSYNPFEAANGVNAQQVAAVPQPFYQSQNPYARYQTYPQPQQQQQQQQPQPGRFDKNSILALYNLSPATTMSTIPEQTQASQPQQTNLSSSTTTEPPTSQPSTTTSPSADPAQQAGSRNPFHTASTNTSPSTTTNGLGIGKAPPPTTVSTTRPVHMSQASVDITASQTGRTSPDSWAQLSARYA